VKQQVRILREF